MNHDMTSLHIRLLGGFGIAVDGFPVPGLHQPRLQALLAYLLLNRQAPQSRQSIAFHFWPDSTDKQARNNLRRLLYSLRRALPQADHHLFITTETIHWHSDATRVLDVAQFEAVVEQAQQANSQNQVLSALQKAQALYSGDLLPGFYEGWILEERERLRSLNAGILTQLSSLYEVEREYGAALDVARRLLNRDLMQESSYRLLIRLHLLNDDRAAALAVYHRCATMLRDELGVDPSPLTEELYQRVLQLETEVHPLTPLSRSAVSLPLVGRHQEWRELRAAWRRAQKAPPSLLLIQGEAGIGKTRLAEELVNTVKRQGMVAFYTRAYAAEGVGPYAPLVDLLRSRGHPAVLAELEPVWLSELARLVPELRSGRKDIPVPRPMTDAWQRNRFHEALARGLLAAAQPLLIHFDDLQWCDPETLTWLRFLLAYDRRARLLIVGTVRDDEIEEDHPLNLLRYDLEQKGRCSVVALNPLEPRDVAQLAAEVVGKELSPGEADRLVAETEGNPLFLVETLRAEDSVPVEAKRRLPPKVQAVIQWRLAQLAPEARQLAATAAVIGRRFSHDLLASVSELSSQALVRRLDELWRRRIIREDSAGSYDFSHDRLRDVAYGQISPMQRRYLHQQVARALLDGRHPDLGLVAGRVAHHYEQAGDEQAAHYLLKAGEQALGICSFSEARATFERALALLPETSSIRLTLQVRLGEALYALSDYPAAKKVLGAALKTTYHQSDTLHAADTVYWLSQVAAIEGEFSQSRSYLEDCLPLARRAQDETSLARALYGLGDLYWRLGEHHKAKAALEECLALARETGDTTRELFALNRLATAIWFQGNLDEAIPLLEEGLARAEQLGHQERLAHFLNNRGEAAREQGEFELAYAHFRRTLPLIQNIGHRQGTVCVLRNLAEEEFRNDDFPSARQHLYEGLTLGHRIGTKVWVLHCIQVAGWMLVRQGETRQGLTLLGLAVNHPATESGHRYLVQRKLERLRLDPADPTVAAQLEAGKDLDLDEVVEELLEELKPG